MDRKEFEAAFNAELRNGFDEVSQLWRQYAVIHPASVFRTPQHPEGVDTYGSLISVTKQAVEYGEWRRQARELGSSYARKLNELFWGEASRYGGPTYEQLAGLLPRSIVDMMNDVEVRVYFLNGEQYPCADVCDAANDGSYQVRVFSDVGLRGKRREQPTAIVCRGVDLEMAKRLIATPTE